MAPISKSFPQQPVVGADMPVQASSPSVSGGAAVNQPIFAFQWVSLARATWTWLIRPLWLLCVKWPVMMVLPHRISEKEWEERLRRERDNENADRAAKAMVRNMRQER